MKSYDLKKKFKCAFQNRYELFFGRFLKTDIKPGRRQVLIKCCFHDDKHPSLSLNLDRGLFQCFACGVGGDAFHFAALRYGLDAKKDFAILLKKLKGEFNL